MARAETTQHCVVWVALEHQHVARAWNESREDRYPPELFDDLWGRFEAPVEGNRWDRPLICYSPRPPSEGAEEKEGRRSTRDEVYQQVLAAITEGKAPAAGLSTATAPRNDADALFLLDQVTQRLLSSILERQKTSMPGDIITVPEARTPVCFRR
ncbi:chromatin associated protein kti12 [Nannochloropsis gaditana]|uniref:Chromatin associated protein kti12 n=2 Tax=Nannochloropsis gaditana TaxID=72520 RepID=W7TPU8_9STRA|nr:chromatin associated protein kti12 [Nannochloropsis gaditana]